MSNISQIVTLTLLYAMKETNNNYTNNNSNGFERIFENSISSIGNNSSTCSSCSNNSLEMLTTPIGIMNQNKVNSSQNIWQNNSSNSDMNKAIELLEDQLGKDYVWGATGPNQFDCSGLVQYIYKNALGKDIPRVSYDQSNYGQEVKKENLQVGDLVFFDTMNKGRVSHVGMYVGNNEFIHAANPNDGVIKSELSGYYADNYICARRP